MNDIARQLTQAVRNADRNFEKVGGSSRHYVHDCLLPALAEQGLEVRSLTETSPISVTPDENPMKLAAEALRTKALLEDLEDWLSEHAPRDGLGVVMADEQKRRFAMLERVREALTKGTK